MWKAAALVVAMAGGWAQGVMAQEASGTYTIKGTNVDGQPYTGLVHISPLTSSTCTMVWNTGTTFTGFCMRSGGVLAAMYTFAGGSGLVIYEYGSDGTLHGTWTTPGINGVGTEILTPQ